MGTRHIKLKDLPTMLIAPKVQGRTKRLVAEYIPGERGPKAHIKSYGKNHTPKSIIFNTSTANPKEILRFTEDKMFLHGKEIDCPQDVIQGMRDWLTSQNYFENKRKAEKYDKLLEILE